MRLALAVLLVACSAHHGEPTAPQGSGSAPPPAAAIRDADAAKAHAGTRVAVQGDARDAKLAAAIVNPGFVVYCLGLESWPKEVANQAVTAHGKLEQTDEFAAKNPGDEGTSGPVWVLRDCQYDAPH